MHRVSVVFNVIYDFSHLLNHVDISDPHCLLAVEFKKAWIVLDELSRMAQEMTTLGRNLVPENIDQLVGCALISQLRVV